MNATTTKTRYRLIGLILAVLVFALAALAGIGGYVFMKGWEISHLSYHPSGPSLLGASSAVPPSGTGIAATASESTAILPGLPAPVAIDPTAIAPSLKPWDGAGRVTILILGLDYRDWQQKVDYSRSDTMILLTLDPATKTGGILSIPRDMWVAIPGFEHGKINTAYYLGEAYKLPGGGPALATKTVEQFLGVPINYYAQVDFGAFVRFIDELGGVTIDVPSPITISLQGQEGIKGKKTLKPGRQALPGEWALAYARDRHTEDGDFDRAGRQQQVIMAIRERLLDRNMLPTIIQKAPVLYQELASGIHTNLKLDDVIRLALAAKNVTKENIRQGILGKNTVVFGSSPDNLSILIPMPDKIGLLRDQIFTTSGSMKPATPGDSLQRMQAESARLAIYNGSKDPTLADRTAAYLKAQSADVAETGQADKVYYTTTLIDHTGSPFTLQYLADLIGDQNIKIYSRYDPESKIDVEVYLGYDWANKNTLP